MLTVYKKSSNCKDSERFFDYNVKSFDLGSATNELILSVMDRAQYLGGDLLETPFGKVRTKDLSSATKLALCLVNYPGFVFRSASLDKRSLERILTLPDGQLLLELQHPLTYLFKVNIKTGDGFKLHTSTDINVWYFKENPNISIVSGDIKRLYEERVRTMLY